MTLSQRIAAINLANTYGELRDAKDRFWDEAVAEHPEVHTCSPLRYSVENGTYDRALVALANLASTSGRSYPDLSRLARRRGPANRAYSGRVGSAQSGLTKPPPLSATGSAPRLTAALYLRRFIAFARVCRCVQ